MEAASVTIKAIDASAVHRIQSGQVIVNLCSVAKELVENSLDAGATSIEVRFKNQGLDSVEVQDNGSGIAPQNYASLALKHYTSKLATYDDLDTLQTFGFRGEALSSLCALSHFTVTTCLATDVPKGTRLEFETSGRLGSTSVVAAQKGTTVAVDNLFWNLPVRRRELERNIKREWGKVISLLNQYACIQIGVKFTVSQQPTKGKRVVLFSTRGNAATRDNIINVFGAKTMGALIPLDLTLELEPTRDAKSKWLAASSSGGSDGDTNAGSGTQEIHVRGYVSRPAHGQGRQTPDRQMFYVNGRPCKLPQFAQLFGEVYRAYNSSQSPFIFADIQLDTHLYDVNVSPDKQTILLHDQGRMLENLRESLIELFEKQDITVPVSQLASQKISAFKKPSISRFSSTTPASSDAGESGEIVRGGRAASPPSIEIKAEAPVAGAAADSRGSTKDAKADDMAEAEIRQSDNAAEGDTSEQIFSEAPLAFPTARKAAETTVGEADPTITPSSFSPLSKPHPLPMKTTSVVLSPRPRKRLSHDVATVTVGDETLSTAVVTSSKRQKTASNAARRPMSTETLLQKNTRKTKAPKPSFGGRLTQMFSAAGASSQLQNNGDHDSENDDDNESESYDEEEEEDEVEDEDEEDLQEEEVGEEELDPDSEGSEEEEAGNSRRSREHQNSDSLPMDSILQEDSGEDLEQQKSPIGTGPTIREEEDKEVDDGEREEEQGEEERGGEEEETEESEEKNADDRRGILVESRSEDEIDKRSRLFLKSGGSKKRHETLKLVQVLKTDESLLRGQAASWQITHQQSKSLSNLHGSGTDDDQLQGGVDKADTAAAEEKLSLTIAKSDFAKMRVIGQFNLGFILAVRESSSRKNRDAEGEEGEEADKPQAHHDDDELFIIDQHASDEKYNFERLQASTVVQSQRLVQPKRLDLTAVEEEIVLEHLPALAANGFTVQVDTDGSAPVGQRCRLLTLPLSRETTFDLADLEELIALLGDEVSASLAAVPRPAKVRKMFAMRACRSSIMIGRALSRRQMAAVLAHMGEMDKPWNCPHGRPTMRHLCSLGAAWDGGRTWVEGQGYDGDGEADGDPGRIRDADWASFLKKRRRQA